MAIRADVDPSNPSLIVFNEPVTLAQAVQYLWGRPPTSYPNPLRSESGSPTSASRRFVVDTSAPGLLLSIQVPHISQFYIRRIQGGVITTTAPSTLPAWVPQPVQDLIFNGRVSDGVTRFHGSPPWGDIVV